MILNWPNLKGVWLIEGRDEFNIIAPYTELGKREARELVFVTHNMASLATSSLLVGYHQDVNLGAHILTMDATFLPRDEWHKLARSGWNARHIGNENNEAQYGEWLQRFEERCRRQSVEMYSGRCLYSTLLPEDFEWSYNGRIVREGILMSGLMNNEAASKSSGSMGMVMYRTYGATESIMWLNGSYHMLNEFLIYKGITLGFDNLEVSEQQRNAINDLVDKAMTREDLAFDVGCIRDPVLRERKEAEIDQELKNIRERVAVMVTAPTEPNLASRIQGQVDGDVIIYAQQYAIEPNCAGDMLCLSADPLPANAEKIMDIPNAYRLPIDGVNITLDFYSGFIEWARPNEESVRLSMGIFNRVIARVRRSETSTVDIDRTYRMPNPLRMMVESGARGNATNEIQIAGVVGQLTYGNGRIPRMLGDRSMPTYPHGTNIPESRGFISRSFLQGIPPSMYMASHVASRENLTSNTDLTPRTGYFERRVRIFTENLRISRIGGRQVVTNERGAIVMWDYILDPSRIFSKGGRTFVDVAYESRRINGTALVRNADGIVYVPISYHGSLSSYLNVDERITHIVDTFPVDTRIILACDPQIEVKHPDFYAYLKDHYMKELGRNNIFVLTIPNGKTRWYMNLDKDANRVAVISPSVSRSTIRKVFQEYSRGRMGDGVSAMIAINTGDINRLSFSVKSGNIVPVHILYQMMVYGYNLDGTAMIVKPHTTSNRASLLDTLILAGNIISL